MSARKTNQVGRTPWDLLSGLFHDGTALKWAAAIGWLVLVGLGAAIWSGRVTLLWRDSQIVDGQRMKGCEDFGVTMTPRNESAAAAADITVSGSAKSLPRPFQLWLVTTGPSGSRAFWPRDQIQFQGESWAVKVHPYTGRPGAAKPGDKKRFAVLVAGPDGQALIESYRSTLRQVAQGREWPPITEKTLDMALCDGRHEVTLTNDR